MQQTLTARSEADPAKVIDLSSDSDLEILHFIHEHRGGPRAAYAWAIGRVPFHGPFKDEFFTADLQTQKVEDFILAFYAAYNSRFGMTY